ncbi:MAG TPA: HAMP domain-containing sensor histidine kinase, partial [Candidatus Limnocylindria bacterium]|nr:HAMP domain-containing sensor histidine kinase [Candidatus Limnocylindria bacterium]
METPIPATDQLATVLLPLVRDGVGAPELAARASGDLLRIDAGQATRLLERLADLGLVRISEVGESGDPRYVLTTLGQRAADAQIGFQPALVTELAELERLRTDLLATIAHELRTPLTAIRTCVSLLGDASLSPTEEERRRLLATAERSAERMQRLLEELLELARFRAGRVTMEMRHFDAVALARDAAAAVKPLADLAGQRLEVVAQADAIPAVGDRRRLEQALLNLVSNAQKFSPPDAPLRVEVAANADVVSWTVIDRGPGIAPEDQVRLFERFFVGT